MPYPGRTPTDPPAPAPDLTTSGGTVLASAGMSAGVRSPVLAYAASVLDRHETELVEEALQAVDSRTPADAEILRGLVEELKSTSSLLDRQRPLRRPTALGGEPRNEQTLIDYLCTLDGLGGDLALPLKA